MAKTPNNVTQISALQRVGVVGYPNGEYLASTNFPNTTNLYGWRMTDNDVATILPVFSSIGLTRNGALTSAFDYLGASKSI